jgi:hypothetical protein
MIILKIILMVLIMVTTPQQTEKDILLNASVMEAENQWRIVNDGVMGGLSSSNVTINEADKIVFKGTVSLDNNGGFASLRSPVKNYNFEKFSGIELRMKGDGKRYSISMKETSYFTGYFYTKSFETTKDEWVVIKIPFDEFKLYYYGKETNSDKNIPLNNIKEISLLIGDKQKGDFITEVDYIKLY